MLVTPLGSVVGTEVGEGGIELFDVLLVIGGGTLVNDEAGGVVIGGSDVLELGRTVELGGGGNVVLETGGGSMTVEEIGGGRMVELGGAGGSVVDETTPDPVPGGVLSGSVISVDDGSGGSGTLVVSVAFWTGGATLVIAETMSLRIEVSGSKGSFVFDLSVGAGEDVASEDEDDVVSLTTPVGAITMPVLELLFVGATDTGTDDAGSEVGGFEIGILGPSEGFAVGGRLDSWLTGTSEVRLGSGAVPLFFPRAGVGLGTEGTVTVLWTTTVVTAAATLGKGRSVKFSIKSAKFDCRFVGVEEASSLELETELSIDVMVELEYCRLTCLGKYILLRSLVSWPATDTAAAKAATKTEVVRILWLNR